MKRLIVGMLLIVMSFSVVACSDDSGYERPVYDEVEAADYLVEANKVIYDDDTVSFTDDTGAFVTLPRGPQKVYILFASYVSVWYDVGGTAAGVIGGEAIDVYETEIGRDITQDTDEDGNAVTEIYAELPVASNWFTEDLVNAQPDLVLVSTVMSGYSVMEGPCKAAGIDLVGIDYNSVEDYLKYFKIFALLNNNEEAFNDLALEVLDNIVDIINSIEDDGTNPSAVSMFTSSEPMVNLSSTDIGEVLEDLKTYNPAEDELGLSGADRVTVNLEQMLTINPDYIIIQVHTTEDAAWSVIYDSLAKYDAWETLTAVKNNNVYYAPRNLFHYKANSRYDEAYLWVAERLYPDIDYSDIEIVKGRTT